MTGQIAVASDEEVNIRWRAWRARGAASDRRSRLRMRTVLALIIALFAVWAVVQLT